MEAGTKDSKTTEEEEEESKDVFWDVQSHSSGTTSPSSPGYSKRDSVEDKSRANKATVVDIVVTDESKKKEEEEEEVIDFIIVWAKPYSHKEEIEDEANRADTKRTIFEDNLKKRGLILNRVQNGHLTFVTIYAPRSVLLTYADIMKLRMPMKVYDDVDGDLMKSSNILSNAASSILKFFTWCLAIRPENMPPKKVPLTSQYVKDKPYLFDEDSPDFLNPPKRSLIVDFILSRESFTAKTDLYNNVGIQRLIEDGIYKAAYPLHDGDWKAPSDNGTSLRYNLYKEWAQLKNWIKIQPVDQIKEYLGVKCAFYFVWLGFYTHMLIPASVVGFLVFMYGVFTLNNDSLSRDICNKSLNIIMCPLCDKTCDYWKLSDTCNSARITYLFDNYLTVIFAFLMSIWTTLFLECWKRYSAAITHRWGLTHFTLEAEHPRPNYLARVSHLKRKKTIRNMITRTDEPKPPFWIKWPTTMLSFSVVLFLTLVALGIVFGIVVYRMSLYSSLSLKHKADWMNSYGIVIIPFTAATINLVCIQFLNFVYARVATYMTEQEYLRTQTEFDESLAIKIYVFQFVNYYTSIFYIAFIKGKFIGRPAKYTRVFNLRQEECSPGGCFMDLCIQLAVIMVGQQIFNSIVEMFIPYFWKLYNVFMMTTGLGDEVDPDKGKDFQKLAEAKETEEEIQQRNDNSAQKEDQLLKDTNRHQLDCTSSIEMNLLSKDDSDRRTDKLISNLKDRAQNSMKKTLKKTASIISDELVKRSNLLSQSTEVDSRTAQWLEDLKLLDLGTRGLFPEYLEMVMQYGFVVLFISAFPLAPLFALINNIFETRLDAQKFLKYYRRPVPHRAPNIGIWFRILDCVAKLAIISNAVIIAFTSNFIPRLVYTYMESKNQTDEGFLNHTLSFFNTSEFPAHSKPETSLYNNVQFCRYHAYRNPPWFQPPELRYKRTWYSWKLLAARLGFIVIFQNVIQLTMVVLQWLIPDMPKALENQIKREEYMTSDLIIKHETKRATVRQRRNDYRRSKSTANLKDPETNMADFTTKDTKNTS